MASSVSIGWAMWMDGETIDAMLGRQSIAGMYLNQQATAQVTGGVLPSGGALAVTPGSGLTVNVASGYCVVPSSSGNSYGAYQCSAMTATSGLTIATPDSVNPRVDLVCATVVDGGTSASYWELQVVTGTPAASPAAPATPSNSIPLAQVSVPANATSIASSGVTDARTFIVMAGGITPVRNLQAAMSAQPGYPGAYVHDMTSNRLVLWNGAKQLQPILLPFTPVANVNANVVNTIGPYQQICQATVTTDGQTDIEIIAQWVGISIATASTQTDPAFADFSLQIDSTQVAQQATAPLDASKVQLNVAYSGGTIHHVTSGLTGDTPSAGQHVISFGFAAHYDGTHQLSVPGTQSPSLLYVRAVPK